MVTGLVTAVANDNDLDITMKHSYKGQISSIASKP